jgi:hypothetical protein
MIRLVRFNYKPAKPVPPNLSDYPGVVFLVEPVGGERCEADYFAIAPEDNWQGGTELIVVFSSEQSDEKIEELRKLLETRINEYHDGCTWFVQIAEAVVDGLDQLGYPVVAHSSYVPD